MRVARGNSTLVVNIDLRTDIERIRTERMLTFLNVISIMLILQFNDLLVVFLNCFFVRVKECSDVIMM